MKAAKPRKAARTKARKPKTVPAVAPTPQPSAQPSAKPRRDPVPQPHGGALVPGAGGGRENGLLGGRPRDTTRALFRKLLRDELAPAAVAVVKNSKKVGDHFEALERFAAIGFNERLRLAQLDAQTRVNAAAASQSGSSAQVQVHVGGPPTGLERSASEVQNG
jgi:hypothetical protein